MLHVYKYRAILSLGADLVILKISFLKLVMVELVVTKLNPIDFIGSALSMNLSGSYQPT